ncbi:hypothetical protein [Pedobacter arcticus]|uniref:hypothetical protein n=1 Tax=Pedobacter arcticus TaxID=752140 RepID=UPI0018728F72|nr:hypothetical protein [Pedobacter arcticus]
MLIILSGCTLFKEKIRLEQDSVSVVKSSNRRELKQGRWSSVIALTENSLVQHLFIEADAPFKWKADSGLSGGAGSYHILMMKKESSLRKKVALSEQELLEKNEKNKRESLKRRMLKQEILPVAFNWKFCFWIGLLLFFGLCYLRWRR